MQLVVAKKRLREKTHMNLKKKKTDMMGREEEERDNMKALLDECLTWCIDCTMSPCICVLTKLELRIM